MFLYSLIVAVTVLLAWQTNQSSFQDQQLHIERPGYAGSRGQLRNRVLCIGIFLILFAFSALRFGIGNDYLQYMKTFHEISVGGYVVTEPGFNLVVKLIYFLCGGEYYEVVFALFALATLALFLHTFWKYSSDFTMTFFLFMTLGLYFQTYNTVRYYFVLAVVLYSIHFIFEKQYAKFVILILMASLMHKSVLIVLPLYFIAKLTWRWWLVTLTVIGSVICMVFHNQMLQLALILYPSYRNTIYLNGGTSIVSILRCLLILAFGVLYYRKYIDKDKELRFYFHMNTMAILVYVCFSFLPVITRIGYYLTVSHIFFIPALIAKMEDNRQKKIVTGMVITASIVYFALFLYKASGEGVQLLPYQSWLFMDERLQLEHGIQ